MLVQENEGWVDYKAYAKELHNVPTHRSGVRANMKLLGAEFAIDTPATTLGELPVRPGGCRGATHGVTTHAVT